MKKRSIIWLLMAVLVLTLVCSLNGNAQAAKKRTKKSNSKTEEAITTSENANSSVPSADSKTVTVTVDGYGETLEAAKKDALHNAMQEVVGTLVDAETRVRNEEIIEDILTASNGFVSSNKVQSVKKEDGFFKVTLRAEVVRSVLSEHLQAKLKTTHKLDGASLADQVDTQMKSEGDCAKMLAKFLVEENFPYSCLKFEVSPVKVINAADVSTLEAKAVMSCDEKKYQEFVQKLVKLLDKIAVKKLADGIAGNKKNNCIYTSDKNVSNALYKERLKNICFVNTFSTPDLARTTWNAYVLSPKAAAVLRLYERQCAKLELKLLDKEGKTLKVKRVNNKFSREYHGLFYHLMNTPNEKYYPAEISIQPFITDLLWGGGDFHFIRTTCPFTMELSVPKADLAKLDSQEASIIPPLTGKQILEKVDAMLKRFDNGEDENAINSLDNDKKEDKDDDLDDDEDDDDEAVLLTTD